MKRDKKGRFLSKKDIELLQVKQDLQNEKYRTERLKQENEQTADKVRQFLDKLGAVRLKATSEPDFGARGGMRYRLVVEIDEMMVHRAFEWGNDANIIRMLGEQLGHQAAREIATLNMRRYR